MSIELSSAPAGSDPLIVWSQWSDSWGFCLSRHRIFNTTSPHSSLFIRGINQSFATPHNFLVRFCPACFLVYSRSILWHLHIQSDSTAKSRRTPIHLRLEDVICSVLSSMRCKVSQHPEEPNLCLYLVWPYATGTMANGSSLDFTGNVD